MKKEPKPKGVDDALKAGSVIARKHGADADEYVSGVIKGAAAEEGTEMTKQADVLVAIGGEAELFHNETGTPFAQLQVDDHREVHPIKGTRFRGYLSSTYYERMGTVAGNSAVQEAVHTLAGMASHGGIEHPVPFRVFPDSEGIWYDLADKHWRVVRVTPAGWEIRDGGAVRFRRFLNSSAQVEPARGGSLDSLRRFLRAKNDDDFRLMLAFLIAAFVPGTPRPVLVITGEAGSAKTTTARVIRKLVDPAVAETIHVPRSPDEFAQCAEHCWMMCLDNQREIPDALSDALCRLVTGDGFQKRSLYTDDDDVVRSFRRVVVLNGIGTVVTNSDLLDRSLIVELEPILPSERKTEEDFWREFDAERPEILGALLDAVSTTLARLGDVKPSGEVRMADFERIGLAAELALGWPKGAFGKALRRNSQAQVEEAIEGNPVAVALLWLIENGGPFLDADGCWNGTATDLLSILADAAADGAKSQRSCPKTPNQLGTLLAKAAPALRRRGIEVSKDREGHGRRRLLRVKRCKASSASSASSACVTGSQESSEKHDAADDADNADNTLPGVRGSGRVVDGRTDGEKARVHLACELEPTDEADDDGADARGDGSFRGEGDDLGYIDDEPLASELSMEDHEMLFLSPPTPSSHPDIAPDSLDDMMEC